MTPKEMNVYKKIQEDKEREKAIMQDISEAHMIVEDFNEHELTDGEIEEIVHENTQIAAANFAAWVEVANSKE